MNLEIFTKEFYENSYLTVDIFNKLLPFVVEKDMYSSGSFLFMGVERTVETEAILSKVVGDLDAYIEYNAARFDVFCDGISLAALHYEHEKNFPNSDVIYWDKEAECFDFYTSIKEE